MPFVLKRFVLRCIAFTNSHCCGQVIDKILSRVAVGGGIFEYKVRWAGFISSQGTLVQRSVIRKSVDSDEAMDGIDQRLLNGETIDVSITMDSPPSAWRWRCAWMHLVTPRCINGYENGHLKLSDTA